MSNPTSKAEVKIDQFSAFCFFSSLQFDPHQTSTMVEAGEPSFTYGFKSCTILGGHDSYKSISQSISLQFFMDTFHSLSF